MEQRQGLVKDSPAGAGTKLPPTWWIICRQELIELWLKGRVMAFLILFSVLMSFTSVITEWESQLSSIPPRELVFVMLHSTIAFGLFIGLIIGADSISGERERATLEALLLTPTNRRQIMFGKLVAALSPWPAALLLSLPYMYAMSHGHPMLLRDTAIGAVMGTLLAVGFTSFAMLTSTWARTNKNSLFLSLLAYILVLIPTLWPGTAQKGDLGYLLQQLNPMQGTSQFLAKVIVNNRTIQEQMPYAMAALISAVLFPTILIMFAAPKLGIDGGFPRLNLRRAATGIALVVALATLALQGGVPLHAAGAAATEQPLSILIDLDHAVTNTGDSIEFNTIVTNNGSVKSQDLNVSMNIIRIGSGDPVDPEDWSPERSVAVDALEPGASARQSWVVDTIMAGDYMVYITVVPVPADQNSTTQTVSSQGLHVTVNSVLRTNPGGVLPYAIGIPALLTMLAYWIRRRRQPSAAMAA
jgi:ABC-2 family transporter protein